MKKIFKIGIFASLGFFTLGLGFVVAAVALGATWAQFTDTVHEKSPSNGENAFSCSDVQSLELEFGAGELELEETDGDEILVERLWDPTHAVKTKLDDGTLKISTKSSIRNKLKLRIQIPKDHSFDEIRLKLGASAVTAQSLRTDELEVELGAGTFDGTGEIIADESKWQVGMGELTLNRLDCQELEMDCGMGSLSVAMAHPQKYYDCNISCHAGAVTVGNSEFYTGNHRIEGEEAEAEITITCGMGAADITFAED